jgi:glycosyltransferase involved in cell wall biosynthesis
MASEHLMAAPPAILVPERAAAGPPAAAPGPPTAAAAALPAAAPTARAAAGVASPLTLVLLCHPDFKRSNSMPRFARLLAEGYRARGHAVEVWMPRPRAFRLWPFRRGAKWAGYVDEYLLFPLEVRRARRRAPADTVFVFCDQALGPWVPLLADRPHAVHVHDLLALRSALGDLPDHPTGPSGRIYQRYIRRGFQRARHFISVSRCTREELHRFGGVAPATSEVVYHGLNYPFVPLEREALEARLEDAGIGVSAHGYLLHVGGGQWYKNLAGIVHLYAEYARATPAPLPLLCVSPAPNAAVRAALAHVPPSGRVEFLGAVAPATLHALYAGARVLLHPSLAEGFGWPIIEAQACGCPVITTEAAPMNEIAGPAARTLPRLAGPQALGGWAREGAAVLAELLGESPEAQRARAEAARRWSLRFDTDGALDAYLGIYRRALAAQREGAIAEPALREGEVP